MKPQNFKESNVIFSDKEKKDSLVMPALRINNNIVSCWHFTLRERLKLMFSAKVWVHVQTKEVEIPCLKLSTSKNDIIIKKNEKI